MSIIDYNQKLEDRYNSLIEKQVQHLSVFGRLLKPEIYYCLLATVNERTPTLEQFKQAENEPDVPVGDAITRIIYEEIYPTL